MDLMAWALLGTLALGLAVVLEGLRQARNLRKKGEVLGERPSMIGTGMLEFQKILQPDRNVEVIQQDARQEERVRPEHRQARGDADPGASGAD